jgi:1,4-dihydroxy-2-naphthoate octaprenyltransferase
VNNLRDARTDARCGKNTLCVLLGERFGRWEITFLLAAPFTLLPYWAWEGARRLEVTMFPSLAAALPAATAPLAAWVGGEAWRLGVGDAGFNGALTGAAALHLLFGAALALGLALDGVAWRDSFDSSTVSEVREAASATAAALS